MADINKLVPLIFKWEGGYVNDPLDLGGPTNMGVTLKTWQTLGYDKNGDGKTDTADLKLLTREEVVNVVLRRYWDRWQADRIKNQSIANILVDWVWGSGVYGIKIPQGILDVKQDGIVGPKTLSAVNSFGDPSVLFARIKEERIAYIERICMSRPANKRFRKGWLNRLNDFKFAWFWIAAILLFSGCRIIPKQLESSSEIHRVSETAVQTNTSSNLHSEGRTVSGTDTQEKEQTTEYSITVRYEPSSSRNTGEGAIQPQIAETVQKLVIRDRDTRQEVLEEQIFQGFSELFSSEVVSINTDEEEKSKTKEKPGKDPYRWRYLILGVVIAGGVLILFFYRRFKNLKI